MSWRQELSFVIIISSPTSTATLLYVVREPNIHVFIHSNTSSVWNLNLSQGGPFSIHLTDVPLIMGGQKFGWPSITDG